MLYENTGKIHVESFGQIKPVIIYMPQERALPDTIKYLTELWEELLRKSIRLIRSFTEGIKKPEDMLRESILKNVIMIVATTLNNLIRGRGIKSCICRLRSGYHSGCKLEHSKSHE